jgi:hypothetical protein
MYLYMYTRMSMHIYLYLYISGMMLHAYKLEIPQPIPTKASKISNKKRLKTDTHIDRGSVIHDNNTNIEYDNSDDDSVNNDDKTTQYKAIDEVYISDDKGQTSDTQTNIDGLISKDDLCDTNVRSRTESLVDVTNDNTESLVDVTNNNTESLVDVTNNNTKSLVDVTTEDPFVFINGILVIS